MPPDAPPFVLPFSGNPLDRAGDRRADPAWLAGRREAPEARFLLLWRGQPLLEGEAGEENTSLAFVGSGTVAALGAAAEETVFLGLDGETPIFARDVSALDEPLAALAPGLKGSGHFRDARECLPLLAAPQLAILAQAKALIDWHARHPFCSRCGAKTEAADSGYRRRCGACGTDHFPRTDPCVIMLVVKEGACLLARNKRFGVAHTYSTLAGFMEPGESIEDAVRREVFEEAGIETGAVRYFGTQPWPFPASLMIGCYAEAATHDIRIDGNEIIAARWLERAIVRRLIAGEDFEDVKLPRRQAIAYHLIRNWAEQ